MPLKTIVNNIPKIDFFTVFPAGFFVLIVLALIVRAETDNSDLWFQIDAMALLVKDNPVELIIIGFSSYLFGNLLRAFPVKYAEALLPGNDKFPYSKGLKTSLEELELNAHEINLDKSKLPDLTNEVTPLVFNYWKDTLCVNSQAAFDYYQTFEARARFFVSMFFSGIIGVIGSLGIYLMGLYFTGDFKVSAACWQLFALSVFMIVAFGAELKYTREQETKVLLLLFVSHLQNRERQG